MQYFVGKNGQQLGPFGEEQIKSRVASGEFAGTDLIWKEGMAAWEPIATVLNNPYLPTAVLGASPLLAAQLQSRPLAGRGARLGAVVLDNVLMGLCAVPAIPPYMALLEATENGGDPSAALSGSGGSLLAAGLLLMLVFGIVQLVLLSRTGQTVGKRICRVRVARFEDGTNPGFVKAVLLLGFVPGLIGAIPLLGLVFALVNICFIFREDKRCIHDLIAGTNVLEA
jgi:uncharacterized RDD family membrane protein YckC